MQEDSKSIKRVIYLDILRIWATVSVVMIHVCAVNWGCIDVHSYEWNILNIYDSISRCGVPVFVMISGVFFLDNDKKITLQKLWKRNIFRLIYAYLFARFINQIVFIFVEWIETGKFDFYVTELIKEIIFVPGQQWFLIMLAGLYIITPFLRKITENECLIKYFLLLALFFTFIIPTILKLPILSRFESVYNVMNFYFTLGYSGYYVLGYYISKKEISVKTEVAIYSLGIVAVLYTILATRFASYELGEAYSGYYDNMSINVMLSCVALFVFAKQHISKIRFSYKSDNVITKISRFTFCIYLLHSAIIEILKVAGLTTSLFNAILSVPFCVVVVLLIALLVAWGFYSIPVLRKYVL